MSATDSKAVIYCRYSPKKRDEVTESLEYQENHVRRYFEFLRIGVAKVIYDPEVSARRVPLSKREGGSELLKITSGRNPQFLIVGCYRLDRLFRDVVDGNLTLRMWTKAGVQCHFAAEGGQSINTSNATGRFLVNMLLSMAAFEPDMTSERTSAALKQLMVNGFSAGKHPPYGKRFGDPVEVEKNGVTVLRRTLVDDPEESQVAERIRYLHDEKHFNYSEIVRILIQDGVPARTGAWSHPKVSRICRRPKDGHSNTQEQQLD